MRRFAQNLIQRVLIVPGRALWQMVRGGEEEKAKQGLSEMAKQLAEAAAEEDPEIASELTEPKPTLFSLAMLNFIATAQSAIWTGPPFPVPEKAEVPMGGPLPDQLEMTFGSDGDAEIFRACCQEFKDIGAELLLVGWNGPEKLKQSLFVTIDNRTIELFGRDAYRGARERTTAGYRFGVFVRLAGRMPSEPNAPAPNSGRFDNHGVIIFWRADDQQKKFYPPHPIDGWFKPGLRMHPGRAHLQSPDNVVSATMAPVPWFVPDDPIYDGDFTNDQSSFLALLSQARANGCAVYCVDWVGPENHILWCVEIDGVAFFFDKEQALRAGGVSAHEDLHSPRAGFFIEMAPRELPSTGQNAPIGGTPSAVEMGGDQSSSTVVLTPPVVPEAIWHQTLIIVSHWPKTRQQS